MLIVRARVVSWNDSNYPPSEWSRCVGRAHDDQLRVDCASIYELGGGHLLQVRLSSSERKGKFKERFVPGTQGKTIKGYNNQMPSSVNTLHL